MRMIGRWLCSTILKRLEGEEIPGVYSLRFITKYGDCKWIENNGVVITWEGKPATLNFLSDITARKRAEEALQESEERFRQVYNHMSVGVAKVSLEFKIKAANPAYCKMLGYREEELTGKHLRDITHPESLEKNILKQSQLAAGKIDHFRMEKRFIHKNSKIVHGILDASLVRDCDGKPIYFWEVLLTLPIANMPRDCCGRAKKIPFHVGFHERCRIYLQP